jgi:hypothetical protein
MGLVRLVVWSDARRRVHTYLHQKACSQNLYIYLSMTLLLATGQTIFTLIYCVHTSKKKKLVLSLPVEVQIFKWF